MSDDLRVQLGKSTVENKQKSDFPWPPEVWEAAMHAFKNGWRKPEPRFPVILSPDSPVSTPEKLQELAGLTSVPEIQHTTKTYPYGDEYVESYESQKVQICDLSWEELMKMEESAVCEATSTVVWFQDTKRAARVVVSLKKENGQTGSGATKSPS